MLTKTRDIYEPKLQLSYPYSLIYLYCILTYNYLKYVNNYLNFKMIFMQYFYANIKAQRVRVAQIIISSSDDIIQSNN